MKAESETFFKGLSPNSSQSESFDTKNSELLRLHALADSMKFILVHYPNSLNESGSEFYNLATSSLKFHNERYRYNPLEQVHYDHSSIGDKVRSLWQHLADGTVGIKFKDEKTSHGVMRVEYLESENRIFMGNEVFGIELSENIGLNDEKPRLTLVLPAKLSEYSLSNIRLIGKIAALAHVIDTVEKALKDENAIKDFIKDFKPDKNTRLHIVGMETLLDVLGRDEHVNMRNFLSFNQVVLEYIKAYN